MQSPLFKGLWGLMRGSVYALSTIYTGLRSLMRASIYSMSTILRAVGTDEGVCICYVHYIQGCGA